MSGNRPGSGTPKGDAEDFYGTSNLNAKFVPGGTGPTSGRRSSGHRTPEASPRRGGARPDTGRRSGQPTTFGRPAASPTPPPQRPHSSHASSHGSPVHAQPRAPVRPTGPSPGGFTITEQSFAPPASSPGSAAAAPPGGGTASITSSAASRGPPSSLPAGAFTVTPGVASQYQNYMKAGNEPKDGLPKHGSVGNSLASETSSQQSAPLRAKAKLSSAWAKVSRQTSQLGGSDANSGDGGSPDKAGLPTIPEDVDPTLTELNETRPSFLASCVAKWPLLSMLLLLLGILGLCAPALAVEKYRPKMNNEFESLQIKDDKTAADVAAVRTLQDYNRPFWNSDPAALQRQQAARQAGKSLEGFEKANGRRLLAAEEGAFEAAEAHVQHSRGLLGAAGAAGVRGIADHLQAHRSLLGAASAGPVRFVDAGGGLQLSVGVVNGPGRRLTQRETVAGQQRTELTRSLSIFYRYADNSTAITDTLVDMARGIEAAIMTRPSYSLICLQQEDQSCHAPFGLPSMVYARPKGGKVPVDTDAESVDDAVESASGDTLYELSETKQRNVADTAQVLVDADFKLFFNIHANATYAQFLHSLVPFSEPDNQKDTFEGMFDRLFDIFKQGEEKGDGSGKEVIVNFGEPQLIKAQVDRQLLNDALWAVLSVVLAAIMLRIGSQSTLLTVAGVFMILASFPISWLIYAAPKGWQYINFIHFLAPFVVLGIGLDDIFVFTSFFETTRPYAGHFALDTRLTSTFMRASGATLATSTTSAFAFAANIFSPVPAVQSFGLLLATIVVVNYLLVITWLPVCLAVWDRYILQPSLRRAAAGKATGCLRCCLETSAANAANEAAAAAAVAPPPPPRLLEYGAIAWPFKDPPPHHRLAAPPEFREAIRVPAAAAGPNRRARFFGAAFDLVWRLRWLTILLVLAITIAGAVGTAALNPPPTSEPPLFQPEHNVQFFWRYSNSDEANNRPQCATCRFSFADTFQDPVDVINNPDKYFKNGDGSNPIGKAEGLSSVEVDLVWGIKPNADGNPTVDNSPNAEGDPIEAMQDVHFETLENFDLANAEDQKLVLGHIEDLFDTSTDPPSTRQETLVGAIKDNPIQAFREHCTPPEGGSLEPPPPASERPYCDTLDPETGLPTGDAFREGLFRFLANGDGVRYRPFFTLVNQRTGGANDYIRQRFGADGADAWPRVSTVRVRVTSSTVKSVSPEKVRESYETWTQWAKGIRSSSPKPSLFVSSPEWITAVTYTEISDSVYTTVFLSIALAGVVVFIFAGKPLLTLIATFTVLAINVTVMGILYLRGWDLGAIEGMSITSLVGLSVDFCIHMVEGHIHARAGTRRGNAREALVLVGIPMAASAISTVITTTPLFATQTRILNSFASVIAITMSVGLLYVWLFLTPLIGMFGPKTVHSDAGMNPDAPLWKRVVHTLYMSKAIRFIVVCALLYLFLRFMPGSTQEFENNGIAAELGKMLAYLLAAAAAVVITRVTIRIIQTNRALHEKRVLAAERAAEDAVFENTEGQVHRAPDQTFALPRPGPARSGAPTAQPSGRAPRGGFAAAARRSVRSGRDRLRHSGSSLGSRGSGGTGPSGARPVTGFGRGSVANDGPGSTPPPGYPGPNGSGRYAPSQ